MTSVYFAARGSGEDGDEYDVEDVFATRELAEAYCNRPDKPGWSHPYVQEWEVTGSLLTDAEREAVRFAATAALPETEKLGGVAGELCRMHAATLRGLLERLK